MRKEINYVVLASIKNYNTEGMKEATAPRQQRILFLNRPIKDQSFLETEIFKSFLGEDLGKKEFFLEAGSYGYIIEAYENTLKTLLEKEHKVPEEYYNRLEEYKEKVHRSLFTDKEYTDNHFYDEVHEILGEYYVLPMRFPNERIPYEFNRYYLSIKRMFDSGEPLYISTAMPFEDLGL